MASTPNSMGNMLRIGRIALLATLCALLFAVSAGGQGGSAAESRAEQYWLGPYFAGLRMTGTSERTFAYGKCELPEGEGGCSLPLQVQNWSSCARNPIGLDVLPQQVFLLRGGGLAAVYDPTSIDIGTGDQTVTVFTEPELAGAALREVHTRSQSGPAPLAPPRYPLPVLRELKRVTVAAARLDGVEAIARAIDLPAAEVRLRLRIAELLGPDALAGVPAPTMSTATVERLRQLSFKAASSPARTARENGVSVASLRAKIRLVRGLTASC